MACTINASVTSTGLIHSGDATGNLSLQSNGVNGLTLDTSLNVSLANNLSTTGNISTSRGTVTALVSGTAQAATSGTSIDFPSIPSWVKRITVMFSGVSTTGTSDFLIQIGDSNGLSNSGYTSAAVAIGSTPALASSTAGFIITQVVAATSFYNGHVVITNITGNSWVSSHTFGAGTPQVGSGIKTLTGTLDRLRVTTATGTNTFDAGTINILYE